MCRMYAIKSRTFLHDLKSTLLHDCFKNSAACPRPYEYEYIYIHTCTFMEYLQIIRYLQFKILLVLKLVLIMYINYS